MFQKQPDSLRLAAHRAPVTPEPPRYRPSTQHRPAASCPLCRAHSGPLPTTASFSQHHPGPATPNIRATPAAVPFLSESPSDRNSNRGASGWHPDPWGQRSWRRHQTRSDRSGLAPSGPRPLPAATRHTQRGGNRSRYGAGSTHPRRLRSTRGAAAESAASGLLCTRAPLRAVLLPAQEKARRATSEPSA